MSQPNIAVIGAGLAGSEAALQLAKLGASVTLYEMKPKKRPPAHHRLDFAEIVCSNSFGSQGLATASGVIKEEMAVMGCQLLAIAQSVAVPAGKALAVDRDKFSEAVTATINNHPNITVVCEEVAGLPQEHNNTRHDATVIATGPLTAPGLAETLAKLTNRDRLFFFDAASPILTRESVDFSVAWVQDRYNAQADAMADEGDSYINCPLTQQQYDDLVAFILAAEKTELKEFEKEAAGKATFFESCLPVEEIARRGPQTLAFGPMKPVGLTNPHNPDKRPYAVVQLRQDNAEGTLYNMVGFQTNIKWGPQKQMIQMIPGLQKADVVRYGVMHRNTYLHSPEVLSPTLQLNNHPTVLIGGQLTGTEGYTESIATGMVAAHNAYRVATGQTPLTLPKESMLGALLAYITREEAKGKSFQPINSNWGILPKPSKAVYGKQLRDKRQRHAIQAEIALKSLADWWPNATQQPVAPMV